MIHTLESGSTLNWLPVQHHEEARRELFLQEHRGAASLSAVVAVMLAFCIGGGVMWKTYREGASSRPQCEMVCRGP